MKSQFTIDDARRALAEWAGRPPRPSSHSRLMSRLEQTPQGKRPAGLAALAAAVVAVAVLVAWPRSHEAPPSVVETAAVRPEMESLVVMQLASGTTLYLAVGGEGARTASNDNTWGRE